MLGERLKLFLRFIKTEKKSGAETDTVRKQVGPSYLCSVKTSSMSSIISIYLKNGDRASEASFARCLTVILMSALAPVLCPGCSGPEPAFAEVGGLGETATKIHLTAAGVEESGIRSLDIFFFNDDPMQRLDTYQHMEGNGLAAAVGASRSGRKILAVLVNSPYDKYRWASVNSLSGLADMLIDLQDEESGHPFMSGTARTDAGTVRDVSVAVSPRTARIEVASLRCDFRGRSYEGAALEDVKVYLTHVSASCPVLGDSSRAPFSFVNPGRLSESDLKGFRDPGLVCAVLPQPVGDTPLRPDITLYCYQNQEEESGPGRPSTRLVIEGKVDGETCYYPFEINRGTTGYPPPGIQADRTYRFDLTFTRKGASDPDGSLEPGTVQVRLAVADWHAQKDTVITF